MQILYWRIKQDGLVVASGSGEASRSLAEMAHYAMVYAEDGPVSCFIRTPTGKWKPHDADN